MLSWSSSTAGREVDLAGVATGDDSIDLVAGAELLRFAAACAGRDDEELAAARTALVAATDAAFMVDAAAVAANFEMMTRLADGTGARLPADVLEDRSDAIRAMGVEHLTTRR